MKMEISVQVTHQNLTKESKHWFIHNHSFMKNGEWIDIYV